VGVCPVPDGAASTSGEQAAASSMAAIVRVTRMFRVVFI
jgi:hypothetical protein